MQCHVFKSTKPSSKRTQAAALATVAKKNITVKHKTKRIRHFHLWTKKKAEAEFI